MRLSKIMAEISANRERIEALESEVKRLRETLDAATEAGDDYEATFRKGLEGLMAYSMDAALKGLDGDS